MLIGIFLEMNYLTALGNFFFLSIFEYSNIYINSKFELIMSKVNLMLFENMQNNCGFD